MSSMTIGSVEDPVAMMSRDKELELKRNTPVSATRKQSGHAPHEEQACMKRSTTPSTILHVVTVYTLPSSMTRCHTYIHTYTYTHKTSYIVSLYTKQ